MGGVKFEHTHRMIAQGAGILTIILAVWTWRVEKRRWLRYLALAALGTVIAQGILGGITVLFYLPPAVSSAHAALAQTFFCIAVAIALFTGKKWIEEQPRVEFDQRRPSLFTLTLLSIFVLYVQLTLGAMFRHHGLSWWPHVRKCRRSFVRAGLDGDPGAHHLFPHRSRSSPRDYDVVPADCPAVLRLHRVSNARSLGPGRRATRTSHGGVHGGSRSGGSITAGDYGDPGDSSLATRTGSLRRKIAACATGSFGA